MLPWKTLEEAAEHCNTVFFDIQVHNGPNARSTGVDNLFILGDLGKLVASPFRGSPSPSGPR